MHRYRILKSEYLDEARRDKVFIFPETLTIKGWFAMRSLRRAGSLFLIYLLFVSVPISVLADTGSNKDPSFVVQLKGRLLTVKVRDIPLKRVLTEIAHQAQIKILFYGPVEELLSADFSEIPLDKGVRRLTGGCNYAFIYGPKAAKTAEPEIREIIIYPKTGGRGGKGGRPTVIAPSQQVPDEQEEAVLVSLFKALEDKDPLVREETVYLLSEFEDERVTRHLTQVLLKDEDEAVRASAAEELGDLGDQGAVDSLIKALGDKNARVRESVAEALGQIGGESAIPKLIKALGDEDEDVRDAAAEALGEIRERLEISGSE